jgi:hypothetical protein
MNNKVILGSLALDLKRVALGYYKGSDKTAGIFLEEALKRTQEVDSNNLKPYLKNILDKISELKSLDKQKLAEDALMYSTLIQNAALKF